MERRRRHHLLPEELVGEILLRLPTISLLRFKCVCKSWWLTINSPRFKFQHFLSHQNDINTSSSTGSSSTDNLHLLLIQFHIPSQRRGFDFCTRASHHCSMLSCDTQGAVQKRSCHALQKRSCHAPLIDPDYYKFQNIYITCCCNGLILFPVYSAMSGGWWSLWNPTTGETMLLPHSPSKCSELQGKGSLILQSTGLGFDTKTMDYKVVTIYKFVDTLNTSVVFDMYSLKANSWTTIASFSNRVLEVHYWWRGVFSNGMLSWKAMCKEDGNNIQVEACISVDLSSGTVVTTLLPSSISRHGYLRYTIMHNNYPLDYKESLAIVNFAARGGCYRERSFDIWVLGEYGVKESWKKLFTIKPLRGISRVVGFWKDGKVFAQTFREEKFCPRLQKKIVKRQLLLLDTLSPTQHTTTLQNFGGDFHMEVFTYKENLVPLKSFYA